MSLCWPSLHLALDAMCWMCAYLIKFIFPIHQARAFLQSGRTKVFQAQPGSRVDMRIPFPPRDVSAPLSVLNSGYLSISPKGPGSHFSGKRDFLRVFSGRGVPEVGWVLVLKDPHPLGPAAGSWASLPVCEPLECKAQARTWEGFPSVPQAYFSDLKGRCLFQEPWMASPETDSGFVGSETSRVSPLTQTPEHRFSQIRYPGDPISVHT